VKPTPDDCVHITVEIVLEIHSEALRNFGGSPGIRDEALLASAVFAPQSTFGGKSPFADIVEIGVAYLFYLCGNHPFVDGNKRTAMAAAIVYLWLNGIETQPDSERWENFVLDVAASRIDRAETTARLGKLIRTRKRKR
jgi:death-on-curing protein